MPRSNVQSHRKFLPIVDIRRGLGSVALAMLLAMALTASAGAVPLSSACTKAYPPRTLDFTQPINLGQLKGQLYFYACSGAYDAELARVLGEARAYLETRASKVKMPAIVLDIDETSLSNLPQMLVNDFGYFKKGPCTLEPQYPCGADAWEMSKKAKAIDPTLQLFDAAKKMKVAVFFITGRRLTEQDKEKDPLYIATAENLKNAQYADWQDLILRPPTAHNMTTTQFKSGEREKIAAKGYTIIVNAGDQHSDLNGGFAERAYKLPNPFYYLP